MSITVLLLVIHVLSVVLWIGGVAFVTTIALPMLTSWPAADRFTVFRAIESRFGAQARFLVLVAGLSGGALLFRLRLTGLLSRPAGFWLDGMIGLWGLFMLILFVVEPLLLAKKMAEFAQRDPDRAHMLLLRGHRVLLALAIIVIIGGVWGAAGGAG